MFGNFNIFGGGPKSKMEKPIKDDGLEQNLENQEQKKINARVAEILGNGGIFPGNPGFETALERAVELAAREIENKEGH